MHTAELVDLHRALSVERPTNVSKALQGAAKALILAVQAREQGSADHARACMDNARTWIASAEFHAQIARVRRGATALQGSALTGALQDACAMLARAAMQRELGNLQWAREALEHAREHVARAELYRAFRDTLLALEIADTCPRETIDC